MSSTIDALDALLLLERVGPLPGIDVRNSDLYDVLRLRVVTALERDAKREQERLDGLMGGFAPVGYKPPDPPTLNLKSDEELPKAPGLLASRSETIKEGTARAEALQWSQRPSDVRQTVQEGIDLNRNLVISYTKPTAGASERTIKPFNIEDKKHHFQAGTTSYVLARDLGDDVTKTFRLDRIEKARLA